MTAVLEVVPPAQSRRRQRVRRFDDAVDAVERHNLQGGRRVPVPPELRQLIRDVCGVERLPRGLNGAEAHEYLMDRMAALVGPDRRRAVPY